MSNSHTRKRNWTKPVSGCVRLWNVGRRCISATWPKLSPPIVTLKTMIFATAEERAVFFSGLWRTRPGLTRGEGYTVSVLLEADVRACHERDTQGEPTRDWIRQHEVAIPFREAVLKWERLGVIRIAPHNAVAYDYNEETHEGTGAQWKRN